jgi:hypothetical protein
MKTLRQLCVAFVFVFALAIPALADGEIQIGVAPPPPPPASARTATTTGEIETTNEGQAGTSGGEVSATGSATNAALNLVQSVLALF